MQSYSPPTFEEADRLKQISPLFPTLDVFYRDYAAKHHVPGYAYGIVLDGQLVHTGCGGWVDLEKKIPVTSCSFFRIASMTKGFTAMAILQLRDAGKLNLDDPISRYISAWRQSGLTTDTAPTTIRDLLTHSGGFSCDDPWGDRKLNATTKELFTLLEKGVLFSNPTATLYEYSNLGYTILGAIIEVVSGVSYHTFVAANIWEPLHMREASWDFADIPQSALAQGYKRVGRKWEKEELLGRGIFDAMGGMITSIESFARYAAFHLSAWPARDAIESGPLKRSSVREMHRPWQLIKLDPKFTYRPGRSCATVRHYGYGLGIVRDAFGRVLIGHSGGLPGFGSNWEIMPDYGLGVIFFANATYTPARVANVAALDRLLAETSLKPRRLSPSDILRQRQDALMRLLPHWEGALTSGLFAHNFFLDHSLEVRKKKTLQLFSKLGRVMSTDVVEADNQLRGHFLIRGEKQDLRVYFSLAPEPPGLIQELEMKQVRK